MADPPSVGALARYQEAMGRAAAAHLLPLTDDVIARASQGIGSLLFGGAPSDPIPPKALKRDEVVLLKLFFGMVQITDAFDMLKDAEVYIRRFPYQGLIPPHRFMRYHITNFYNNVYVLSERLKQYATIVGRSYRKATHVAKSEDTISNLNRMVVTVMRPINDDRGTYIHQSHFQDDHFERLSLTTLLATRAQGQADDQFKHSMARLNKVSFRRARKEWGEIFASDIENISRLLDSYFAIIHKIVLDKDNHIVYPHPPRAKSD